LTTNKKEAKAMKRIMLIGMLVLVTSVVLFIPVPANAMEHQKIGKAVYTQSVVDLRNAMRQLWEEHIVYTRGYITSALAGLDDTGKVAERLLRNQDDIGNAIKPIYGEEAGKKLAALLRDHILIAADIVTAAKAGDNDGVAKGEKRWTANADDIAAFLSSANPNWPIQTLKDMLYKHLAFTTTEVVSRIKKDWSSDIEAYDKGHAHMLMFADMLTDGIVKQFPKKFTM
jgi:competence protein ComGC